MGKKIIQYVLLLLFAIVCVYATTLKPIEIQTRSDLESLTCGWPMQFIANDLSWRDPPLPWKINCLAGEWGDIPKFNIIAFIVDVTVFLVVSLILKVGIFALLHWYKESSLKNHEKNT